MPRNPTTGVFTRVSNSFSEPVLGEVIDPTAADAYYDDVDGGITDSVAPPASSTDNAIARFNGTTGKFVQNSAVTIGDTGIMAGASIDGGANTLTNIPASAVSGEALTRTNDTNVTITLGGTPATALLKATSLTVGWSGTLAAARGGFGADVSASSGVPLFAAGVPTFTGATGTGDFVRAASPTLTGTITAAAANFSGTITFGTGTITGLTNKASPSGADDYVIIYDAAGTAIKKATVGSVGSAGSVSSVNGQTGAIALRVDPGGRLTLTSATPVLTSTVSAATTIYYTPYIHDQIMLYDGTNLVPTTFTETSQTLSDSTKSPSGAAADNNYDMFVWNDSGTIRCTRGPAWTNSTTRSAGTALTRVNGVLLNNASITNGPAASRGTYVGTIRVNGSTQVEWTYGSAATDGGAAYFGVFNAYNRVNVSTISQSTRDSWTYATNTWRTPAAAGTGLTIFFVRGLDEESVTATYQVPTFASAAVAGMAGVGLDSTTAPSGMFTWSANITNATGFTSGTYTGLPGIGWHYVQALENATGSTMTFYGDNGTNYLQNGLTAQLRM